MYLTRILLSIVFVLFASTALAVKPEKTITPDRNTFTESAPVAAVNVDPARDAGDCVVRPDNSRATKRDGVSLGRKKTIFVELDDKPSKLALPDSMAPRQPKTRTTVKSQITPEESAPVATVNVDPDRDDVDQEETDTTQIQQRSAAPSTEMPKTQGMNVSSRMVAIRAPNTETPEAEATRPKATAKVKSQITWCPPDGPS